MDKSRVEPTIFLIEKISFSLKLFSSHFHGQSFIKTVRGPLILKLRYPNLHALKTNKQYTQMTTTASEVYSDVVLLYKLNIFQSRTFSIKIYDILKNNILTCSLLASVESWLLWRYASRSSLLYSGFKYTIELPLQPYKIHLYTFRVQGLAIFLPWFPD